MNGIHAALTGRIGKDAEVRTARDGKPWASMVDAKTDGEAPATLGVGGGGGQVPLDTSSGNPTLSGITGQVAL